MDKRTLDTLLIRMDILTFWKAHLNTFVISLSEVF